MSTSLVEGEVYIANKIWTGESSRGPYEIIRVRTAGARQPIIGLSVLNVPSNIGHNGAFRVDRIHSVLVRNSQDKDGNWYTGGSVTVKAEISPVSDEEAPENPLTKPRKRKQPQTEFTGLEDWFND